MGDVRVRSVDGVPTVRWAVGELREALAGRVGDPPVLVADRAGLASDPSTADFAARIPDLPETVALTELHLDGRRTIVASGSDARGVSYAVLELVDRARLSAEPLAVRSPIVESPANPIRGVARLFVSDVEDLPWFLDREFWPPYLSMLATQRFNRLHLAFGIGHDFLRNVRDAYLLFPYPLLVAPAGHAVRATGVSDDERRRNLDTLRYISDHATLRGLHFQLGIWTSAYEWVASPNASHTFDGLDAGNHAAYCRDALRTLLQECPGIAGVTLRVHGESGVPEGSYDFWREVFRGVAECGRRVELDLHPKGVDRQMIDMALATGLDVTISPKYTAEHMGLPGHQAAIRPTELDQVYLTEHEPLMGTLMARSAGDMRYTRYGNADFLREDRRYGLYYRIWPGTQRLLLWGDPALAAGFGRHGSFCGARGVEICEPLSFKGRRGSGLPGGRTAYADAGLAPTHDWQKYEYTYRLFGRLLFDPSAEASTWRRYLDAAHGESAGPIERALAAASRILPLVTSAHHPSAANNRFWPEVYTNQPTVESDREAPYRDTLMPPVLARTSPLDPATFCRIDELVDQLIEGRRDGRLSPLWVAARLADHSAATLDALDEVRNDGVATRRAAIDARIVAWLGRFFAHKLRAGVAFEIGRRTDDSARIDQALEEYRLARAAWEQVIGHGRVYRDDITVGGEPWLRGHWRDRMEAIDADIAEMQAARDTMPAATNAAPPLDALEPSLPGAVYQHTSPTAFRQGDAVEIELGVALDASDPVEATLRYRRVNNAEHWRETPMHLENGCFAATIPADYTDSDFPLQYCFELRTGPLHAWRHPGLGPDLAGQAYFVVRRT